MPISELANLQSPASVVLLGHLLVLAASIMLGAYGLYKSVKYSRENPRSAKLLLVAFALIAFIPLGDFFEHLNLFPNGDFWHHAHLFAGVFAFYFFYLFAASIGSETVPELGKAGVLPAILAFILMAVFYNEPWIEDNYPIILTIMYLAAISAIVAYVVLLLRIARTVGQIEKTFFSLKSFSFSIAMIPIISVSLFAVASTSILAEVIRDLVQENAAAGMVALVLIAAQHPLYIMLMMTVTGYGYISQKMYNFYTPIREFLSKAKGGRARKG